MSAVSKHITETTIKSLAGQQCVKNKKANFKLSVPFDSAFWKIKIQQHVQW